MTTSQIEKQIEGLTDDVNGLSTTLDDIRSGITKTVTTEITKELASRGIGELADIEDHLVDDIVGKIVERDEVKKVLLRMETFEKELDRVEDAVRKDKKQSEHSRQFGSFIQAAQTSGFNMGNMPSEVRDYLHSAEYRTLTETVLDEGGFFVPPDVETELLHDVDMYSDIRQIARVTTTTSKDYVVFRRTDIPAATWEDEEGTGTEDQPKYVKVTIPCHPTIVKIPVTMDLLDDSVVNIRAEITADAVLAFAISEGTAFVSGNGVGKPEGFMQNADVAEVAANETVANYVEADDFYDMYFSLLKPYRGRGTFVMNSLTLRNVMKLKEATTNAYIWQNSFQVGAPPAIIGRPYLVAEDMDDDGTNLNHPIAFGDFQRGYRIVDRSGIFLLFDTVTEFPKYRFIWRRRLGGGVTQPEAICKLLL